MRPGTSTFYVSSSGNGSVLMRHVDSARTSMFPPAGGDGRTPVRSASVGKAFLDDLNFDRTGNALA
ncbi:hypothetical protein [Streptantibioticus ferralitis]|uniref:hypothetical protein n=1 Tax=Streptantibioticus ferralitis TaxID=236510 RepID=UPI0023DCC41C|nr:hypothetical protein [Streptantibioticus ferralitis]